MQKEYKTINKLAQVDRSNKSKPGEFTNFKYNRYRSYLQMLFKTLKNYGAIKNNPINKEDVAKRKAVKKKRATLSKADRKRIKEHLSKVNPPFGRFVELFFHLGGRITELISMQVKDVDLKGQVYRTVIKKGIQYEEVDRTIKNIAVPLMKELIIGSQAEYFVFSKGLIPGAQHIRPSQITRRWNTWVKKQLGIKEDLYSLKHSNSSEIAATLGDEAAAAQMGHKSTAMVVNIYDTERQNREHERLKQAGNDF